MGGGASRYMRVPSDHILRCRHAIAENDAIRGETDGNSLLCDARMAMAIGFTGMDVMSFETDLFISLFFALCDVQSV